MGPRGHIAPAAGAVSVALVAVVRVAREARPRRRVTCVRVPQAPFKSPQAPAQPEPVRVPASSPDTAAADVAMPEPPAVVALEPPVVVAPELPVVVAPELPVVVAPELPVVVAPEPMAAIDSEATLIIAAWPQPMPPPTVLEPPVVTVLEPTPDLAAWVPAADPVQLAEPEPMFKQEPAWGWSEPWSFEVPATARRRGPGTTAHPSREASRRQDRENKWLQLAVTLALLAFAAGVWIVAPWSPSANSQPGAATHTGFTPHPSGFALRTIPSAYLHQYWRAAEEYGLNWTKLAAVGQIESDQGRSNAAGVSHGTNPDGAAGPAQFLGTTWARFGVDADGRGSINPYDPADAITAMAAYLKASGAPQRWRAALYAYNHSLGYADSVLALSRRYLGPHPARR